MDENEFRTAYHSINTTKCVFEKSILTLNCTCCFQQKFNLAEREGIQCTQPEQQENCSLFLNQIRKQAGFALGLSQIVGNLLPHSKEIQVQKGALLGLLPQLPNLPDTKIDDISSVINTAVEKSAGDLNQFPYQTLISSISHHPTRPRRSRRQKKKD